MKHARTVASLILLLVALAAFSACRRPTPSPRSGVAPVATAPAISTEHYFTAYNMWCEKANTFQCINFKRGVLIPAGSEVTNVGVTRVSRRTEAIVFSIVSSSNAALAGQAYTVQFDARYHPGKTIGDYRAMMFTSKNFEALTAGMTTKEIDAIRQGVLVTGMSKAAVLVGYGPPPEHVTPTRDANVWTYFENRYQKKAIQFDMQGRTVKPTAAAQPVVQDQL